MPANFGQLRRRACLCLHVNRSLGMMVHLPLSYFGKVRAEGVMAGKNISCLVDDWFAKSGQ